MMKIIKPLDIKRNRYFYTFYLVTIGVKGFDGVVQTVAGLIFLFYPSSISIMLAKATTLAQRGDSDFFNWLTATIVKTEADIASQSLFYITTFLLSHGLVKIVLVYCLLKEYYKVYPYALILLSILLPPQLAALYSRPTSIILWFIVALNILIIYIVWSEYVYIKNVVSMKRIRDK